MATDAQTICLEVATPTGWAVEKLEVSSVQAPSTFGEFGVLPGHLPLLVALKAGPLHYVINGETHHAAMGGMGYAQVERDPGGSDKVRILTEFFQRPEDVDIEAAQADLEAAIANLKAASTEDVDRSSLERDEAWARARIEVASYAAN
jgi:F-type H+-transporting ATPase subunit epsilon